MNVTATKKFLNLKKTAASLGQIIFVVYGIAYFLFYGLDYFKKGFVTDFLSLNVILLIFVGGGLLALLEDKR